MLLELCILYISIFIVRFILRYSTVKNENKFLGIDRNYDYELASINYTGLWET